MTGPELAKLLAPLLGIGARDRLRALMVGGSSDIAIRYDEVTPDTWAKMGNIILEGNRNNTINLYDGEEWFLLELTGANDDPNSGTSSGDRVGT